MVRDPFTVCLLGGVDVTEKRKRPSGGLNEEGWSATNSCLLTLHHHILPVNYNAKPSPDNT